MPRQQFSEARVQGGTADCVEIPVQVLNQARVKAMEDMSEEAFVAAAVKGIGETTLYGNDAVRYTQALTGRGRSTRGQSIPSGRLCPRRVAESTLCQCLVTSVVRERPRPRLPSATTPSLPHLAILQSG